jgi:hypothetical protein
MINLHGKPSGPDNALAATPRISRPSMAYAFDEVPKHQAG